jgi:DNA-binding CsgD family transcriptional regulator
MLTQIEQERLVGDILRASFESVTLEDLGAQVLPLIERAFETSASVLNVIEDQGQIVPMAGTLRKDGFEYFEKYWLEDPMPKALRDLNPLVMYASRVPEWKIYLKHPVYADFYRPRQIHYFAVLQLLDSGNILLARSRHQSDFNKRDEWLLARILPALETLTRRDIRAKQRFRAHSIVETVLDLDHRPRIALDPQGGFLWASEHAETLVGLRRGGRKVVPDALVGAVRRLGALVGKDPSRVAPVSSVAIPRENAAPIRAELRLARTRMGETFVLAELEVSEVPSRIADAAARFQLTAAETEVLRLISAGLSDEAITHRLFVSMATVRTHVSHILDKLGVSSRVQAALLAHGLRSSTDLGGETPLRDSPRPRPPSVKQS